MTWTQNPDGSWEASTGAWREQFTYRVTCIPGSVTHLHDRYTLATSDAELLAEEDRQDDYAHAETARIVADSIEREWLEEAHG